MPKSDHVPELDGIRGVAIGLVVLFHYFHEAAVLAPGSIASHLLLPLRIGWTGVDLFFVLSGFLIGGILLDVRESSNYFKTFYIRRFFRIIPLYAAVVLLSFLLAVFLEHGHLPQLAWLLDGQISWWPYLFFLQNFWMAKTNTFGTLCLGGTWSLAVEEQFYLTLPLIIWLIEPRKLQKLLIAAVVAAPVIRTLLYFRWPDKFMLDFVMMPCRADALLLGVLAAMAMRTPADRSWIKAHRRLLLAAMLVLLAGCAELAHASPRPESLAMRTFGYSWMALLYGTVLLYSLTQESSLISRFLRIGFLRSLGRVAYGVYLLHGFVLLFLTTALSRNHPVHAYWPALDSWFQFGVTVFALVLTFGVCQVSWKLFEKPLVDIGHRYRYDVPLGDTIRPHITDSL